MGPNETGPQGVDKTVVDNEPNLEAVADTDEACKTLEGYNSASDADEYGELELNLEIDDENRGVELSYSGDINGDDQDTVCNDENSGDSQGCESVYSAKIEPDIETSDVIKNRADMELDYDMDDPLEFARQVANEVGREVEDCEQVSSNSNSNSLDEALESVSQLKEPESDVLVQPESENLVDEQANAVQEIENSRVVNVNMNRALLDDDAEKSVCDFDLNEEVRVEKIDQISTPIADCSAATSTFHLVNGSNNSSKQQHEDPLDFDLNNIHECSVEPDVETTEKLNLDLNCLTFEEQQIQQQYHNLSSPSSKMTFDLNNHPSFVSEHYGTPIAANDPVISIMGVKVDVNKSNNNTSNSYQFSDGSECDPMPSVDVNLGLFGTESASTYVYNAPTIGGAISTPMYGQYRQFDAYMFDSTQAQPGFHYPHLMTGMDTGIGFIPESNGVEPSDLSLNLNAMSVFNGNTEIGGIQQYSYTPQTTNLIAGMMKRREPESGWERELFPLKRHQPT